MIARPSVMNVSVISSMLFSKLTFQKGAEQPALILPPMKVAKKFRECGPKSLQVHVHVVGFPDAHDVGFVTQGLKLHERHVLDFVSGRKGSQGDSRVSQQHPQPSSRWVRAGVNMSLKLLMT